MGRSLADRAVPRIRPITEGRLTDDERDRLEHHPALDHYPLGDYVSMPRLRFLRWLYAMGRVTP
jgi:hypothetical protein